MDVYQSTLTCSECKHASKVIITAETKSVECENCNAALMKLKRFNGVIYVLKNQDVRGVKIGMTNHDVHRRAKQISGTGTPGHFEVMAAFPSHNPSKDERKVHDKLKRYRMQREHFDLEPDEAIVKVRTTLGKDWVLIHKSIRTKVEERVADQRTKTKLRFQSTPKGTSPSQIDLFTHRNEKATAKRPAEPKVEKAKRGKGFLANLFQN